MFVWASSDSATDFREVSVRQVIGLGHRLALILLMALVGCGQAVSTTTRLPRMIPPTVATPPPAALADCRPVSDATAIPIATEGNTTTFHLTGAPPPRRTVSPQFVLRGMRDGRPTVAISPDGHWIVVGRDGAVDVFALPATQWRYRCEVVASVPAVYASAAPLDLAFSPDSQLLAIGLGNGPVGIWTVADGRHQTTLDLPSTEFRHLAFSPNSATIAVADTGLVSCWRVSNGTESWRKVTPTQGWMGAVVFPPDGATIVTADEGLKEPHRIEGRSILTWRARDGLLLDERRTEHTGRVALSVTGRYLAEPANDQEAIITDLSQPGLQEVWTEAHAPRSARTVLRFSADGSLLLGGTEDGRVVVWATADGRLLHQYQQSGGISDMDATPDGTKIVSVEMDGTLVLRQR